MNIFYNSIFNITRLLYSENFICNKKTMKINWLLILDIQMNSNEQAKTLMMSGLNERNSQLQNRVLIHYFTSFHETLDGHLNYTAS